MKALVLFGSTSDEKVYQELANFLKRDFDVDFEVISAHRNPERLETKLNENDFDIVFAGAGLAAHLPGVSASKTNKPVFGIPVEGNLGGLDALLSIVQMPFGIPVGAMSAKKWSSCIELVNNLKLIGSNCINIVAKESIRSTSYYQKEFKRLTDYASSLNISLTENSFEINKVNINFVTKSNEVISEKPCLNVPLLDDDRKNDPKMGLELMNWINEGGFWVGINNSRNAVCFAKKFRG